MSFGGGRRLRRADHAAAALRSEAETLRNGERHGKKENLSIQPHDAWG